MMQIDFTETLHPHSFSGCPERSVVNAVLRLPACSAVNVVLRVLGVLCGEKCRLDLPNRGR
jgi:hypothetical protein